MKTPKLLILLLSIALFACEANKVEELEMQTSNLRLNYYTSSCAGAFFDLTCYHFQIGDEIGTDQWRTDSIYISDFEYEYGYVHDLEVTITPNDLTNCADDCPENNYELLRVISKTQVDNPCMTTPATNQVCTEEYTPVCGCNQQTYSNDCVAATSGITTWTLGECETNENSELSSRTASLRVNYYTSICAGSFTDLTCYHFQIDDEIGTDYWRTDSIYIPDFEHEYGFVYDLEVTITPNDLTNCVDDCPENNYALLRVVSKTQVENPCITAPKPNQVCSLDYTPVCGCDQQTYSNQCIAEASGVTSWTFGECNSDGNTDENTTTNLSSRTANLRVNYYTSLCTGSFTDSITCYHFQIDDEIGTNYWRTDSIYIPDFEHEYGYVYDLEVTITPNDLTNCADDCPENDYKLLRIINKTLIENPCIGTTMPNQVCTTDYTPVCGCDLQIYSNACVAEASGVSTWTLGECN